MCNVNVVNRISCFCLIIFLRGDSGWFWPAPGYAPGLTSVCLTYVCDAYIGPKSRTERPRKTKIGAEVPTLHVTRTPLSRSKGQRSTCRGGAYCGGLPHSLASVQQCRQRWS